MLNRRFVLLGGGRLTVLSWVVAVVLLFGFAVVIADPAPGASTGSVAEVRVSASADDAEENGGGRVSLRSGDLEMTEDKDQQTVGIRFAAVDVPSGATITNAYVQFTAEDQDSGFTDLLIRAESTAMASQFIKSSFDLSTRDVTTAAVSWQPVEWGTIGEAGVDQRTPDVAALLQEVIDLSGWSNSNPVALIITGSGVRSAEWFNGDAAAAPLLHVEYTIGPPPNQPPLVAIAAPTSGSIFVVDDPVSFAATAVDPEEGDVAASLIWTSDLDGVIGFGPGFVTAALSTGSHLVTAQAEDSTGLPGLDTVALSVVATPPNQPPVVTISAPVQDATFTTGDVLSFSATAQDPEDGDVAPGLVWESDVDGVIGAGANFVIATLSMGVHTVTAEAFDSGGMPGTDTVVVTIVADQPPTVVIATPMQLESIPVGVEVLLTGSAIDPEDGDLSASLDWTSNIDGFLGVGASLPISTLSLSTHVVTAEAIDSVGQTGEATVTFTITDPGALQSVAVRVSTGDDDAEESVTGSVSLTSSDLELVDSGGAQTVGIRFVGVDIPQGASIIGAAVQFTVDEIDTGTTNLEIRAHASDDPPGFVALSQDVSSRPTTTNVAMWNPAAWDVVSAAGPAQLTSDIAAVIQEVVDRPGWARGNAIVVLVTGLGVRTAESYNGSSASAPELLVDFTETTNAKPVVSITSPPTAQCSSRARTCRFPATATDAEDGDVGASLVWTSSFDGTIGSGPAFSATLSPGLHTITAVAVDSIGRTGSATIGITVAYSDPILIGAGDIAECSRLDDEATADVLDRYPDATVFTTGNNVYDDGSAVQFAGCYDPSWGRHKERTRPSPGNHDYHIPDAAGYFDYFGANAGTQGEGWYSYDLGTWHIVVLNSNCSSVGGCDIDSPQVRWLQADLAAHSG